MSKQVRKTGEEIRKKWFFLSRFVVWCDARVWCVSASSKVRAAAESASQRASAAVSERWKRSPRKKKKVKNPSDDVVVVVVWFDRTLLCVTTYSLGSGCSAAFSVLSPYLFACRVWSETWNESDIYRSCCCCCCFTNPSPLIDTTTQRRIVAPAPIKPIRELRCF